MDDGVQALQRSITRSKDSTQINGLYLYKILQPARRVFFSTLCENRPLVHELSRIVATKRTALLASGFTTEPIGKRDVLVVVTLSREHKKLIPFINSIRQNGCEIILLSAYPGSKLWGLVDHAICIDVCKVGVDEYSDILFEFSCREIFTNAMNEL